MKLLCDICGGTLQMYPNNNGACCTNCGMNYTLESLRNKLNSGSVPQPPVSPNASPAPQNNVYVNQQNMGTNAPFNGNLHQGANNSVQNNTPFTNAASTQPSAAQATQNSQNRALVVEMKPGGIVAKAYGIIVTVDGVPQPMITQNTGALVIPVCQGEHIVSAEIKKGGKRTEFVIEPMRFCVTAHNWYGLFSFHRGAWTAGFKLDLLEDLEGRLNDLKV